GAAATARRLACRRADGVIGLNIAANTASGDPESDYAQVITTCGPYVNYLTVNVSCPNQDSHFDLRNHATLKRVLSAVKEARSVACPDIPVFLKLSPDLSDADLERIVNLACRAEVSGFIATNTTRHRPPLSSPIRSVTGGLSGVPLFDQSTRILAKVFAATNGTMPIIGVGGIASAADAITKIRAGATALQIYTALVYQGVGLIDAICQGIDVHLQSEGSASVASIVGLDHEQWLT
ncbi:MAG: dihydroorotate dehydrogenase (quinone), partial [Rhodobacteraceae bacterium]|nr:dihydroorotate dehydrogenase (quinone) [Paracoccaceae bacterium]